MERWVSEEIGGKGLEKAIQSGRDGDDGAPKHPAM
jgi:hypothetical protein